MCSEPQIPPELGDRAADNWRHILAIADLAGVDWPHRARTAALTLSLSTPEREDGICELLLNDIRNLFEKLDVDRLFSEDIVLALTEMFDRPWPEFMHNKPITKTKLARLLKPFGIHPMTFRKGDELRKGYSVQSFHDAFSRYATPLATVTPLQGTNGGIRTQQ